jgi:hypothetical protein
LGIPEVDGPAAGTDVPGVTPERDADPIWPEATLLGSRDVLPNRLWFDEEGFARRSSSRSSAGFVTMILGFLIVLRTLFV